MRIKLTGGKYAVVDRRDYSWLSKWKWRCLGSRYAARWSLHPHGERYLIFMHKEILEKIYGSCNKGDHRDRDRLNNRRYNLRLATPAQNQWNKAAPRNNSSGFKGVSITGRQRWRMDIRIGNHRRIHEYFDTAIEAARAYDDLAKKYHGKFAKLNFPMRFPRPYRFPRYREEAISL